MPAYRVEINDITIGNTGIEAYEFADAQAFEQFVATEAASDPAYVVAREPVSYPCLLLIDRDAAQPSHDDDVEALLLPALMFYDFDRT